MMIDFDAFAQELLRANPQLTASDAMAAALEIGDTPELDDQGRAVTSFGPLFLEMRNDWRHRQGRKRPDQTKA